MVQSLCQKSPNSQDLQKALLENRFCLYCQPIIPLNTHSEGCVHKEILLRMVGQDGKLIQPNQFLPYAEEYGLMPSIDRWVLKSFFDGIYHPSKCMGCWARGYYCGCIIAFNLSGSSINNEEFLTFLEEAVTTHPVPPYSLVFEITETVALSNLEKTRQFILRLQKLGCQFALDDFGTGMASLAYLKELPLDFVKIDGMFVRDLATNPVSAAIVSAIVQIAQVKNIQTVAEYVENVQILEQLKELGVGYAQGFYLGKPTPVLQRSPIL
ncbi:MULTISPECIES: EAL domain-containing protein [unclassified Coleofasciculus]|uniref:EAL domain-containing protein n=1 Tax=unclassified Coleofasciculus TaxID=2692782 RepID=UPI0018805509|nr:MULTISPECIES: EAL domain-containing protein [unclassified Coleofasciculus]MBE9128391.1 EAL domain-containing protein [Coleofasciculus sp. LEGE 07081]MBE9147911.1 EAL domain-containing protein [Coleofasciculus sp. LEGE 07092]